MSYPPEIRTEAFDLYLLGNSPGEIADELARRRQGERTPSAKTIEKWAYVPVDGKTWSERRYQAETEARDAVTRDFVSARTKLMRGMLELQSKLQERALSQADEAEPGSFAQEVFAYINATKAADKMLDSKLAEEARAKDGIDCLIEAMRRTVPGFETLRPRIMAEFQKLLAAKQNTTC